MKASKEYKQFVVQTVHVKKTIIFISQKDVTQSNVSNNKQSNNKATQQTTTSEKNKAKTKVLLIIFINGEKKIDRFFLINFSVSSRTGFY